MISTNSNRAAHPRTLRDQSRRVLRDVKELGSIAAENVGDGADRIKARGREFVSSGRDRIERVQGQARKYVAANPFKTLFIAIGVGTLLGLALRRRS